VASLSTPNSEAYCRVAGFDGTVANNCNKATLPDAVPCVRLDGRSDPRVRRLLCGAKSIYCFSNVISDFQNGFEGGGLGARDGTSP